MKISKFWVLEDTSSYVARESGGSSASISMRLHVVRHGAAEVVAETSYRPKAQGRRQNFRTEIVLELLTRARVKSGTIVGGARIANSPGLLKALRAQKLDVVFAVPPGGEGRLLDDQGFEASKALETAGWQVGRFKAPDSEAQYWVADLGRASYGGCDGLYCFALSQGGIRDYRRQLIVGVAALARKRSRNTLAYLLGWSRWIRFVDRRSNKREAAAQEPIVRPSAAELPKSSVEHALRAVPTRSNLKIATELDRRAAGEMQSDLFDSTGALGRLAHKRILNVVELFAGAGGMGLGFLTANVRDRGFRLLVSGEIHPIYATTLQANHDYMVRHGLASEDRVVRDVIPLDLREPTAMDRIQSAARESGGVDIIIGGPPCQGFSSANRNSWSSTNPNNRLVDTFFDYVARLQPKVFVMENVQGILWTQRQGGSITTAAHVVSRSAAAGYRLYPKLLDAAWFGVPQHRSRFFLIGLHEDLGYGQEAFGKWGPYPRPTHGPAAQRPYVTLREAIADLPAIVNGHDADELAYQEPNGSSTEFLAYLRAGAATGVVWDHVVSTHADYVIERYRRIPPGSNWSAIADMMTNYAAIDRTHSNIYRRLTWDEPSITVGHYRKAMLIHPDQHRGLSLREAARLQSFPDWFRFAGTAGTEQGLKKGMSYKQQQVANAVCPLLAKALAELLLEL